MNDCAYSYNNNTANKTQQKISRQTMMNRTRYTQGKDSALNINNIY